MTFDRVLVGMDFSATAVAAAKWVVDHVAPDAELVLAHVLDLPHRPRFAHETLPPDEVIVSAARTYAEHRMHEVVSYLTADQPRVEFRVGRPHEQLRDLARAVHADLIVIGPHGDRPHTASFLGTTAERVVRTAPVPVLVVRMPSPGAPRHLLVPVDESSMTSSVLAAARDLAERFDAALTLVHVWSNAQYSHVASMSHLTAPTEADSLRAIRDDLAEATHYWLAELARAGIDREHVDAVVRYGNAADEALAVAATVHADLIVLGRHGSGLVAPAFLGSTVARVLHGARCPVFVVPGPVDAANG